MARRLSYHRAYDRASKYGRGRIPWLVESEVRASMAHLPINHHLRTLYRVIAALCGLYILTFGILAITRTNDFAFFAQDGLPSALGLRANRAFAVLSVIAGVILVGGAVIGRNVDRWINMVGAVAFLVAGMAMMILMQTGLNFLGFTMATCIVSFIIGLLLLAAGLYVQVGSKGQEVREEQFRHGEAPDAEEHLLGAENVPRARAE
jgi:hypothetical protein